jgi:hypothetical protein
MLRVQNDYDLVKSQTVVVSSKEALEKTRDARAEGKDIVKLVETEFIGENLEDFKKLKQMILKRLTVTSEAIEKRLKRFEELYETLNKDAAEHGIRLPPIVKGPNPPNGGIQRPLGDWIKTARDVLIKTKETIESIRAQLSTPRATHNTTPAVTRPPRRENGKTPRRR